METYLDQRKLETAIILARMYGVKETLEPLPFVSTEDIVTMIVKWAEAYMNTGEDDIVSFFEDRVCSC